MDQVRVKRLRANAIIPSRSTIGSAGYDLSACIEKDLVVEPGKTELIGCGFSMAVPLGYAAFIYARSGLGIKKGMVPANCVGVIDADYRGEVMVGLKNTSKDPFVVHPGDRIAQMVLSGCFTPELIECDELEETSRGSGGFGSTGVAS